MSMDKQKANPLPEEKFNDRGRFSILLILISVALASFFFFSKYQNSIESQNQIAQYENPTYDLLRIESESLDDTWTQATMTFMLKDYRKTLSLIKDLEEDTVFMNSNDGKYYLLKGVSLMRTHHQRIAQKELKKIDSKNSYYDQAQWYLAISYMHDHQADKAKAILTEITKKEYHSKKKEAQAILEGIE